MGEVEYRLLGYYGLWYKVWMLRLRLLPHVVISNMTYSPRFRAHHVSGALASVRCAMWQGFQEINAFPKWSKYPSLQSCRSCILHLITALGPDTITFGYFWMDPLEWNALKKSKPFLEGSSTREI